MTSEPQARNRIIWKRNMKMRVANMPPGTQFMFRGKKFLRVDGPTDFDTLPLIDWYCHPQQRDFLRLAVHVATGILCPFFDDQIGIVKHKPTTPGAGG